MLTKLIYNSIQPYSTLKAFIKKHKLELRSGFKEFYNFSLSLIESLDEKNGHLKFAVVNMQIALELFLKYYFLSKEMPERVFKEPLLSGVYKDFSDILKSYYSVCRELHLSPKKRLITILENRNNIVHKGRFHEWDNELAQSIIECAFFIQHVSMFNFNESLVSAQYLPHKLSKNIHWKKGAQSIANNLCIKSAKQPMECPFCLSKTLVSKEIFALDETYDEDDLQCITCLVDIDTSMSGKLIPCALCRQESYYLDLLNEQSQQVFIGKCLSCGGVLLVRMCAGCGNFYYPDNGEIRKDISFIVWNAPTSLDK